jgi:hypothetical protein
MFIFLKIGSSLLNLFSSIFSYLTPLALSPLVVLFIFILPYLVLLSLCATPTPP